MPKGKDRSFEMSEPRSNRLGSIRLASRTLVTEVGAGIALALFLMRFFVVAESAGQGDTLWIVALWILAFLASSIVACWSQGTGKSFGPLEWCVGLLAGGHILSALVVIATTGEKRSAINLAWEWVGVAIGWGLLRQGRRRAEFRREMLAGLVAVGATVAGLGVYQHYVDFPGIAEKYGRLFDRLRQADPAEAATVRQELAKAQIPLDGPAITLFEKRLRDSREPLGLFALANTLGGVLAVCVILAVSVVASAQRSSKFSFSRHLLPWLLIVLALGWCLLLTKSRTAWIGLATGLGLYSLGTGRLRLTTSQVRNFVGILVVLLLFGWGLSRFGGLDRQVLTEAPKSLQYRLQYWSAAWPMFLDHPWLGVGPGQFRSQYLFYKQAEASEEISDPHNLFLDAATNGGVAALVGLIGLCFTLAWNFRTNCNHVDRVHVDCNRVNMAESDSPGMTVPKVISVIAVVGWFVLLLTAEDDRLLVLVPVSLAVYWLLRWTLGSQKNDPSAVELGMQSAAFALLVHLFGAGGMGMPVVSLLLLVLVSGIEPGISVVPRQSRVNSRVFSGFRVVLGLGLLVGVVFTGLRPVAAVQARLQAGDRFVERGLSEAAGAEYLAAAKADTVSAEPWRRSAELAYRAAESDRFRSNESFQSAVHLMQEVRLRDPVNPHDDRRLGDWWLTRWRVTQQPSDAEEAVTAYNRAWSCYPTNSFVMAELSFAFEAIGKFDQAADVARKALNQDQINHQRGHVDRYLVDSVKEKLGRLVDRQIPR